MPRRTLYPEGKSQLNVILPAPLKKAIDDAAMAEHIPTSTLVVRVLSHWLEQHEAERELVPA